MSEVVEVRYAEPDGTVANDSWSGVVREVQLFDGGRASVRFDDTHVMYGRVSRIVRTPQGSASPAPCGPEPARPQSEDGLSSEETLATLALVGRPRTPQVLCEPCREAVAGWLLDRSVAVGAGGPVAAMLELDCPDDGQRRMEVRCG